MTHLSSLDLQLLVALSLSLSLSLSLANPHCRRHYQDDFVALPYQKWEMGESQVPQVASRASLAAGQRLSEGVICGASSLHRGNA